MTFDQLNNSINYKLQATKQLPFVTISAFTIIWLEGQEKGWGIFFFIKISFFFFKSQLNLMKIPRSKSSQAIVYLWFIALDSYSTFALE